MKEKVILFGASNLGKVALQKLKNKYEILFFCDNSKEKWNTEFCNIKIISPMQLKDNFEGIRVIITSIYSNQIISQLEKMHIKKIDVFNYIHIFNDTRYTLKDIDGDKQLDNKNKKVEKIAFFVNGNIDFCKKIIDSLQKEYYVRICNINDEKDVLDCLNWCDLCWFEWCDILFQYCSNLKIIKSKKVIVRLHLYEIFEKKIYSMNWNIVDKIIFVADWVKEEFLTKIKIEKDKTIVIPNIFDYKEFEFKEKQKGYNIAIVGSIIAKKNIPAVIQLFYELYNINNNYKLYIASYKNEELSYRYIKGIIKKLHLEKSIILCGKIPHEKLSNWFSDKQYILSGSIVESQGLNILEGMACGLKPVINYFPGIECLYPEEYTYFSLRGFVDKFEKEKIESFKYRKFVEDNFRIEETMKRIKEVIRNL
ncbi:glycosyltransferase [Clostridium sp. BJN0001]|uniref:glycosyltransferase n=1 Tax=Clostridium sp. BJN0001 TaxID=2930219 RepID=UPI001FD40CAD|nr:glycosyltransferase [Clostridium sp. BJN0001]